MASAVALGSLLFLPSVVSDCIANTAINDFFVELNGAQETGIPLAGSCCQFDVCGLECPRVLADPGKGE